MPLWSYTRTTYHSILWGDRLIGRMDAKANRVGRQLVIHNLVFEPTLQDFEAVKSAFGSALNDFTRFQECDQWKISRVEPKAFKIPKLGKIL